MENKELNKIIIKNEHVLDVLPKKPSNKTHKHMAAQLGLNPVCLRHKIKQMRRDGIPICSNRKNGYWLARNSDDVMKMIKYLTTYIKSLQKTNTALHETALKMQVEELKGEGLLNE